MPGKYEWEVQFRWISNDEVWIRVQKLSDEDMEDYVREISYIGDDAFVPATTVDDNPMSAVFRAVPSYRKGELI